MMETLTCMEDLKIPATKRTPEINFSDNGELCIKGISTPENVTTFYQPVFDWLEEFKSAKPKLIRIIFDFDYLNTSTTSIILRFLRRVVDMKTNGTDIEIIWYYEEDEDDMAEQGSVLQDLISHPIRIQSK
jgi:hypothetical protein